MIGWHVDRWKSRFFTIWSGQALSLFGSQILQFALIWWLTETSGSATVLAISTLVALVPQIVITPLAGALVDRWDRRKVMIVADGAIALAALGLALLFGFNAIKIWHIYAVIFVRSIGGAFHWTAMFAATAMMVPNESLSRIAGLNSAMQGAATLAAPLIGAVLYATVSMQAIIAIDILTAALAILPLLLIAIPKLVAAQAEATAGSFTLFRDIREGIRYVWRQTGILSIIFIAMVLNFVAFPAFTLLPILVTKHFGREAIDFATLQSVMGAGMIAGGLLLAAWKGLKRRMVAAMLGLMLQGAGILLLGLAPVGMFWLAIVTVVVFSTINPISNGLLTSTIQVIVPPDKIGRVFSLLSSGCQLMSPLGLAIAGPVAEAFGVTMWFILAGGASIMLGLVALFIPAITRLDTLAAKQSRTSIDAVGTEQPPFN
ncbi:MFS transporter [Candidatus Bipolaricaulota bacterium]|nr:MFS transporter [Candidatus Bipolaricaulota bacterium]